MKRVGLRGKWEPVFKSSPECFCTLFVCGKNDYGRDWFSVAEFDGENYYDPYIRENQKYVDILLPEYWMYAPLSPCDSWLK